MVCCNGVYIALWSILNNLRDLEQDRAVSKRTLATIMGRRYANLEYYRLVGGTYYCTSGIGATWLLSSVHPYHPRYNPISSCALLPSRC